MNETIAELRRLANETLDSHQCQLAYEQAHTILGLLDRLDQLEAENKSLIESIREGHCAVEGKLEQYEKELSDLRGVEAAFQRLNVLTHSTRRRLRRMESLALYHPNYVTMDELKEKIRQLVHAAREALAQADSAKEEK